MAKIRLIDCDNPKLKVVNLQDIYKYKRYYKNSLILNVALSIVLLSLLLYKLLF